MTAEEKRQQILNELARRERGMRIELARREFWEYCKLTSPDFYLEERAYLKNYCDTLQKFYERKLKAPNKTIAKRLMISMPPRHGKTRTLIKFTCWVLGRNSKHKTIASAYNDGLAFDFSQFTRDEIREAKVSPEHVVYSDIFPHIRIKRGSSAKKQWAVEGTHFSYRGAGVNGTITGKGGNLLIIDDPVKDEKVAFNENALESLWKWYTGTWLSRKESGALEIITHTPWAKKDISGRILDSELKDSWYLISMPACLNEETGEMLCSSILSFEEYKDLEKSMDPFIFAANYKMVRLDIKGLMYPEFKTYADLPRDESGQPLCTEKLYVADTAGQGADFFCGLYGNSYNGMFYVLDVDYTQEDINITEELTAKKLIGHKAQIAYIENNGAGHSFVYHVEKILQEKYNWFGTNFVEYSQSDNKESRIFVNRIEVMNRVVFPADWRHRWPDFYNSVTTHSREGKNIHDDAADTLTDVAIYLTECGELSQKINQSVI